MQQILNYVKFKMCGGNKAVLYQALVYSNIANALIQTLTLQLFCFFRLREKIYKSGKPPGPGGPR